MKQSLKIRNILLMSILFICMEFMGTSNPGFAASTSLHAQRTEGEIRIFLPLTVSEYTSKSPFWLQIAALSQISITESNTASQRAYAEQEARVDEAFPTLISALKESGAKGTRVFIDWSQIQPDAPVAGESPVYSWTFYDSRLSQIGETGVEILATVARSPSWAAENPCSPIYSEQLSAYTTFLSDLVHRYSQYPYHIKYWEIVNEPDYTLVNSSGWGCWGNYGDDYAATLAAAYPAIKAADPDAQVIQGGIAFDGFTEDGGYFNRYFSDDVMKAGGGSFLDVLNFHYFPDYHEEWERWDPESVYRQNGTLPAPTCGDFFDGQGPTYETGGVDLIAKASHYRNRMKACFGLEKPVWVTELAEHGYAADTDSLAKQARYVIKGYVRGLAAGVEKIVWYALTTPNDNQEQSLLYSDWTPKPSFYAYKTMTGELTGYTYQSTLDETNIEGYIFLSPSGKEKYVVWSSTESENLSFTANQLRLVDRTSNVTLVNDGGTGDLDGVVNQQISIQVTVDPLFVQPE